jgi:hypothetical protein
MDENKALKELEKTEYDEFKENAQIKAIIAGSKAKVKSFTIGDIEIKIKSAIPKGVRDKIAALSKEYQNGEFAVADENMYVVLSEVCIEEPWTKPAAWKMIDAETGEVPNIILKVVEVISSTEASAKNFRNK